MKYKYNYEKPLKKLSSTSLSTPTKNHDENLVNANFPLLFFTCKFLYSFLTSILVKKKNPIQVVQKNGNHHQPSSVFETLGGEIQKQKLLKYN